jgi:hypothetical protein
VGINRLFLTMKRAANASHLTLRSKPAGRYYIRVQRLLTLMLMIALAFVSSTSMAAALCGHQDAQQHAAALVSNDQQVVVTAQLEEAAGELADKQGTLADASSFALPAFILPASTFAPRPQTDKQPLSLGLDARKVTGLSPPPLLEPPAA